MYAVWVIGEPMMLRELCSLLIESLAPLLSCPRLAGEWPMALAVDLANLGLWCAEMDRRDRPDLTEEVIPALLEICEAAAKEVVEWEAKQEAIKERQRAEKEAAEKAAKEAAARKEAEAKADEARKAKEQQAAAEGLKKTTDRSLGGAADGTQAAAKQPACCIVM